ncbi:MAG: hypothetical protein JNM57_02980 [Cyclobacteriaceae bacterium]|nr:hypothetical protein [Cyclobacteriaceae bacterium]
MNKRFLFNVLLLGSILISTGCKNRSNPIHGNWSTCVDGYYEEIYFLDNSSYYYCPSSSIGACFKYPYSISNDSLQLELEPQSFKKFKITKLDKDSLVLEFAWPDNGNSTMFEAKRFSRIPHKISFPRNDKIPDTEVASYIADYQVRMEEKKCNGRDKGAVIGRDPEKLDDILQKQ